MPRRTPTLDRVGIVVGLIVLALLPLVITDTFWLNIFVFAGIYTIVGVGLTLLFGFAGQVSFGHAGFFGIGAYVSALVAIKLGLPVWLTILVGGAAAGAAGFALGRPILQLRGLSLAMATLAFGQIMFILFTQLPITKGPVGLSSIPPLTLGPLTFQTQRSYYWLVVVVALLTLLFSRQVARSYVGRALRAIGNSETAASSVGVPVSSYKARVFGLSAGLAGLAGALYAHYLTFISSDSFTVDFSILLIVIVAIGGMNRLLGAVLGALFVAIVPALLQDTQQLSQLIYGLLLVLAFMFVPDGIVGIPPAVNTRLRALLARRTQTKDAA